jgi:hypothetical protein
MKRGPIVFIPLGRDRLSDVQQHLRSDFGFKGVQPRFEGLDSSHLFIDCWPEVQTPSRRVGEIPFSSVEAEALVNHPCLIVSGLFGTTKGHLPAVGVTRPLVEHQHANKFV